MDHPLSHDSVAEEERQRFATVRSDIQQQLEAQKKAEEAIFDQTQSALKDEYLMQAGMIQREARAQAQADEANALAQEFIGVSMAAGSTGNKD